MKVLGQCRHPILGLANRRAIKEETIAINCDWHANYRMISHVV